jgi:hypothetical protein
MPDPKLIPLYDDTAPIACTITNIEIPERIKLIERMRDAMTSIERTPTGLLLHFADQAGARPDLEAFAVDEKRCFDIVDEPHGVALRWDGPPAADALLSQLETFFTTDAPISVLRGLL